MSTIHILECAAFSSDQEPSFNFDSLGKTISWPMAHGKNLGPGGAWNFFWRLGFTPQMVPVPPEKGDGVLVVSAEGQLSPEAIISLRQWIQKGKPVIFDGNPDIMNIVSEVNTQTSTESPEHPRTGLAWTGVSEQAEIIASFGWEFAKFISTGKGNPVGTLTLVQGELETPKRAYHITHPQTPALIRYDNILYLNGNPFRALQGWLQGQVNLTPWLNWRPRLFWLDEHVASLWRIMVRHIPKLNKLPRPGITGLGPRNIVLRHDVDSSRNTSYLETENQAGIAASHAILLDNNTNFWVNALKKHKEHECCFHYNSSKPHSFMTRVREKLLTRSINYEPGFKQLSPAGLLKQVRKAQHQGISCNTILRHATFALYPEHIECLDILAKNVPEFLGGNNYFSGQWSLWGAYWPISDTANEMDWHSAMCPYWFPFRPVHAGDKGRLLDVWESSCAMEYEPHLVDAMLRHTIKELPQRVITLNYHPFHANHDTFAKSGSLYEFKEIISLITQQKYCTTPLRDVFKYANDALLVR